MLESVSKQWQSTRNIEYWFDMALILMTLGKPSLALA